MKYLILILSLFLIGCKGCDSYSEPTPQRILRLFWDDPNNIPDSLDYYEVQAWGGEDTTGVLNFILFDQVPPHTNPAYVDSIRVSNMWFQYRVRAVDKKGDYSGWAYTRFYKYTEFFLLSVENIRIAK